jgi:hypothetical protein
MSTNDAAGRTELQGIEADWSGSDSSIKPQLTEANVADAVHRMLLKLQIERSKAEIISQQPQNNATLKLNVKASLEIALTSNIN